MGVIDLEIRSVVNSGEVELVADNRLLTLYNRLPIVNI